MRKSATSNEEDLKLIKLIKNNKCNASFKRLEEKHSNLFYSICNKYKNKVDLEEVYKDKSFVMFRSVCSFNPTRGAKFSTWLGNYSRYHCLNFIKNNFKYLNSNEETITHFFNNKSLDDYDANKNHKTDLEHAFAILKKMNDKRIAKIFELRYLHTGEKLTWKQIAKKFDLTPQTIINLHAKGRRTLKNKMKKISWHAAG